MNILGIDLGGTKIEIIALSATGEERYRERVPTPQGDYRVIIATVGTLISQAERAVGKCNAVGIGCPGAISPATGLMKNANSTCLNGRPFLEDLQDYLDRPVYIENDANCFTLSEAVDGAAANAETVFGVIVGTGVGAGICIQKQIIKGANAIGGEWGHNPLPWPKQDELPGLECYCGKQGCIETWLSGPGFARHFLHSSGRQLSAEQITAAALAGDSECEQALADYEDRMARSLAHVINILDPHAIVLGGGMSNIDRLYQNVPALWQQYVFSDIVSTRLFKPVYGDSSGVRGASWLVTNSHLLQCASE